MSGRPDSLDTPQRRGGSTADIRSALDALASTMGPTFCRAAPDLARSSGATIQSAALAAATTGEALVFATERAAGRRRGSPRSAPARSVVASDCRQGNEELPQTPRVRICHINSHGWNPGDMDWTSPYMSCPANYSQDTPTPHYPWRQHAVPLICDTRRLTAREPPSTHWRNLVMDVKTRHRGTGDIVAQPQTDIPVCAGRTCSSALPESWHQGPAASSTNLPRTSPVIVGGCARSDWLVGFWID